LTTFIICSRLILCKVKVVHFSLPNGANIRCRLQARFELKPRSLMVFANIA
jgi:hypothetical protein